jgi:large subunit ribosomal protein L13
VATNLTRITVSANKKTVKHEWLLVDAENQVLGRIASKVALHLRGKHKTYYTPHVDCGDNVVIINAEKVRLTGKKWDDMEIDRYSGYPGGRKLETAREYINRKPTGLLERSIKSMLPKGPLGRAMFRKLHIYAGTTHPYTSQKLKPIK